MAYRVTPGECSCGLLRRSARSRIATKISLLILLAPATAAHALSGVFSVPPMAQRPVNASGATSQEGAGERTLEPGKSLERELTGGESHSYRLRLAAGQFCHVVVEQRGIDVVVALYDSGGAKIVEIDNPNGVNGPEPVSLLAEASGDYRLEVRAPAKDAPTGRYDVKIEELRAATTRDKDRIAAQKAYTDGKALRNRRTAESQRRAIEKYQEALSLWVTLDDRRMEAYSLNEMGLIYGDIGEYQKALDSYAGAHAIYKLIDDPRSQAGMLTNIGWIYGALGEYKKAIDLTEQALEAQRALGDRHDEPLLLSNIGANYAYLGEYQKALDIHMQALDIRRASNDLGGQAITLNNIANCYQHMGDRRRALDYYVQALALMPAAGYVFYTATTLNNIGAIYLELGEAQKALDYYNQALTLRRTIGDLNGEAATLYHIARLERGRGNLVEARNRIEAALATVESLRANIESQRLRVSFFASVRQYHEFNVDLLMRLHELRPSEGFDALALQASEKSRARSLLELLAEARAEIRQGVDPSLLERERALRRMISDKAESLRGKRAEEQAAAAKEIDALTADYDQIEAQIRHSSPRYAALTQPVPLSLKEIQSDVLDEDTLLLEYALGEEKSYLWAVTPTSISGFELPKRSEIEPVARRVYELLIARNQNLPNETPERRRRRLEQAEAEYPKTSATLSQMLLGPVASELRNKRLLVVSDGALQYVPFAALPRPAAPDSRPPAPIIIDNEVVSLPSASVLEVLRRESAGRKPAGKTLAVLADPVFSKDDPRVPSSGKGREAAVEETSPTADVRRSAGESGLPDLVRLRFSRMEADEIARLAPGEMKMEALDFTANRELATSAEIGQYRIVHFATHGLINNLRPELSGVVLSMVDEQGRPQNGFLRLYDIYNLKLGADLVVLSACQTALGKEVKGEGLIGLTRGFMYAGARQVVASLWRVDDRATSELMKRFYRGMLEQGLRPAAALRAAQVSMCKDKRWLAPHYWAAFTIQGEWR
jgi:CHAT domain-containing protein/Tfp pilus assembly protein PilF